jgi:hypothetical protein
VPVKMISQPTQKSARSSRICPETGRVVRQAIVSSSHALLPRCKYIRINPATTPLTSTPGASTCSGTTWALAGRNPPSEVALALEDEDVVTGVLLGEVQALHYLLEGRVIALLLHPLRDAIEHPRLLGSEIKGQTFHGMAL